VVLDAPAAIRPEGTRPPDGTPAEMAARSTPPRADAAVRSAPLEVQQQQQRLVTRLRGPARDATSNGRLADLATPVLVVFGTRDAVIPPEMGRHYKAVLPNCHLVFVYDAGHAIGAERPEAFVELAGDFLERREAFVISRTETMIHP
jgi:pimeloyl-ACP methyl ester carboxylesterase